MILTLKAEALAARPNLRTADFIPDDFFASGGRFSFRGADVIITHDNVHINALNLHPALQNLQRDRVDGNIEIYGEAQITAPEPGEDIDDDFDPDVQEAPVTTAPVAPQQGATVMQAPATGIQPPDVNQNLLLADSDDRNLVRIAGTFNTEISAMARNLETLQKEFSELLSKAIKVKRKIEIATSPIAENPDIARLMESMSALRNHGKVENVFIHRNDNTINVKTKNIITRDAIAGGRRLVGKMLIIIPIKLFIGDIPNLDGLRIWNLTHTIITGANSKWQAPHVQCNGSSCFGDSMSLIIDAIAARDPVLVVDSVIQFLEQPNITDVFGRCASLLPIMAEGQ